MLCELIGSSVILEELSLKKSLLPCSSAQFKLFSFSPLVIRFYGFFFLFFSSKQKSFLKLFSFHERICVSLFTKTSHCHSSHKSLILSAAFAEFSLIFFFFRLILCCALPSSLHFVNLTREPSRLSLKAK